MRVALLFTSLTIAACAPAPKCPVPSCMTTEELNARTAGNGLGKELGPKADGAPKGYTSEGGVQTAAIPSDLLVGKPAPRVHGLAHDGTGIDTDELKGHYVVLYFYPKDETPGCTKEACSFRDAWKELSKDGAVMIGISSDNDESHKKFASHYKLPFFLLSDTDGSIARAYQVPVTNGHTARHTVVIAPDGTVKKVYRKVDVTVHAQEILADLK